MRSPFQPYPLLNKETSQSSHNSAPTTPATKTRSDSPASSVSNIPAAEAPLDLTKPSSVPECETNKPSSSRKRPRKGKANKLDDLCLRLQQKKSSESSEIEVPKSLPPGDGSSAQSIDQDSNEHPSPMELSEETWSEGNSERTSPINYKINVEEPKNNTANSIK